MARESSVTLTPKYRKRRYELRQPAHTENREALAWVDEDIEGHDLVTAQLLNEQQYGAEMTKKALGHASIGERAGSDNLSAQTPAEIINSCSLYGAPKLQKTTGSPMESQDLRASSERRKRQVPINAPESPSKRRLAVRGATLMGNPGSAAGKLERPAFIFGDLTKNKAEVRQKTLDVPKPAGRLLRSTKAPVGVSAEMTEPQNKPAEAADSDSGGRKTRSRALKATGAEGERNQAVNGPDELPQEHSIDTKGPTGRGRRKKSVAVEPVAPGGRTTRSGNPHLRSGRLKVVIHAPTSERHQKSVQGTSHMEQPSGESQNPVTKETRLGTSSSSTGGIEAGGISSPAIQSGQAFRDRNEEADDGEHSDDESPRASEREDEVDESATAPNGSGRSDIAINTGGSVAEAHNEDVDSDSDKDGSEGSERSDEADVADNLDDEDGDTIKGRPKATMPFGQQANWEEVLTSAKNVGLSDRKGVVELKKPKLATSAIQAILEVSSELKKLFLEYGPVYANRDHLDEGSSTRATALREDINHGLKELEVIISQIDEFEAGKMKRKIIQDIYAHGIPELVFLLNEVFLCYLSTPPIRHSGLKTCLWVHDRVLDLCRKASGWSAKPRTKRPIRRATRQSIFPILRNMRKAFRTEQRDMERAMRSKKQMLASKRQLEKTLERERRRHEECEREKDAFVERQKIALDQEEERIKQLRRKYTSSGVPRTTTLSTTPREEAPDEAATSPGSVTPVERVEVFAPRGEVPFHPKRGNGNLNDIASSWTDEERECLLIGLQIYQDPDRYERIVEEYGQAGEPLEHRSFDDLVQRAREEKSNVEAHHEVPEWLQSV